MDLVKHEFVEEEVKPVQDGDKKEKTAKDDEGPSPAKKAKTATEDEVKMVKKSMDFVDLKTALDIDWSQDSYAKRVKRMDPSYFILQVLYLYDELS